MKLVCWIKLCINILVRRLVITLLALLTCLLCLHICILACLSSYLAIYPVWIAGGETYLSSSLFFSFLFSCLATHRFFGSISISHLSILVNAASFALE